MISRSKEVAANRAAIIDKMISRLRQGEDRQYFAGLVEYYIEGIRYSASGLTVDSQATQDLRQTEHGFACTAMFSPDMLEPDTVKTNGIIKVNVAGQIREVVQVRLEVMLDDVWSVAEFIDGTQHNLFLDEETLRSRLKGSSSTAH